MKPEPEPFLINVDEAVLVDLRHRLARWTTGTIGSAFLPYYDFTQAGAMRWILEAARGWIGRSHVPTGLALFAKDGAHPPRAWAQRFFNVQRYTELARGGHFGAFEEPELLAQELRAFFRPLRAG